ncbi:MAG: glycosyl transferase [Silicimonas sp.]|nr:glycosyl transferase [Silicimonas sp.]
MNGASANLCRVPAHRLEAAVVLCAFCRRWGRQRGQSVAHVLFFAFDIAEAAQIRRIESVRKLGHDVASVSFRRTNMNRDFTPDWPDLPLGRTENGKLMLRLKSLGVGLARLLGQRRIAEGRTIWIARNLDMLALAVLFRRLTGRRDVRLTYECLDIHGLMTRRDVVGRVARWIERRLMARTDLLIVSSPGFIDRYFHPVQGYRGQVAIIENKLWTGEGPLPRRARPKDTGGPLVLGWVGSLRCPASLALLEAVARDMGDDIRLVFRGSVHRHALPGFDAVIARHSNMHYGGTYEYPHGLAQVYVACDLVWSQDLWQAGTNSDWLLPNRIYEASYFGCPSVAVRHTVPGQRIEASGLGFTIQEPTPAALSALLRRLSRAENHACAAGLLRQPDTDFRLTLGELETALAPLFSGGRPRSGELSPVAANSGESLGA